jgi:two-component system response regulator YesN
MKHGASDYLLKPVENSELIALLEQFEQTITINYSPVEQAKSYVQGHYRENITLQVISELVHLNAAYFCQLFKKETKMSFNEYLTSYRIDIAKELLKSVDNRICDVAVHVGYNDPGYFCRIFKKVSGLSPKEYRAKWISQG